MVFLTVIFLIVVCSLNYSLLNVDAYMYIVYTIEYEYII